MNLRCETDNCNVALVTTVTGVTAVDHYLRVREMVLENLTFSSLFDALKK